MIEMESGASGISTVERAPRCAPESCHSIVACASPGHGGPSGGLASRVHSPTSGSSRFSASSAVGWSIALRSFLSLAVVSCISFSVLFRNGRSLLHETWGNTAALRSDHLRSPLAEDQVHGHRHGGRRDEIQREAKQHPLPPRHFHAYTHPQISLL